MPELSDGPNSFKDPETSLGGADAVPDTPAVPGHGADIEERATGAARARVRANGWGIWAVVLVVILVLVAAVYLGGIVQ